MPSTRRHTVIFEAACSVEATAGVTLKEAAALAGAALDAPCGGLGTCGRCAVIVERQDGLEPVTDDERRLLGEHRIAAGVRLACRARVTGDVVVRHSEATSGSPVAGVGASLRIVDTGAADAASAVALEPPAARGILGAGPLLGAVIDIGTTTVVAVLLDLETGERLGSASALNPQHPFGHDVMSRITHVAAHGPESLREPIAAQVESLLARVLAEHGVPRESLKEIAIAGNTTMVHLLLGIDPAPLGVAPYEPAFIDPVDRPAEEIGLPGLAGVGVYILPGISAFVGADITAGLLATAIDERPQTTLLIDLGTNGEMVLKTPRGLVGASTAAGPALEGASISSGMRAEPGAIERVALDDAGALVVETIGGGPAKGLCGSGLLDLVAVLLETGLLDHTGRLRGDAPHLLAARISERDGTRAFEMAPGVFLTQRDVRQVQLANAAIASGIGMLLDAEGVAAADVDELIIAGGFGYHVRAEALVEMGMVPREWRDRVSFAGNTAVTGGIMALVNSDARRRAEAIARQTHAIDLARHPEFQTRFVGAMRFPKTVAPAAPTTRAKEPPCA